MVENNYQPPYSGDSVDYQMVTCDFPEVYHLVLRYTLSNDVPPDTGYVILVYNNSHSFSTQKMVGKHKKTLATKIGQECLCQQRQWHRQRRTLPQRCKLNSFLHDGCAHSEATLQE